MGRIIDNQTIYLTQDKIKAAAVDGILAGNFVCDYFFAKGKAWGFGEKYKVNYKFQKSEAMGWYTGMGTFNTTQQKNLVQMSWTPASMYSSATLPYLDLAVNKSNPVMSLEAYQMQSAMDDMIDSIGTAFYGDGTSNQCDGLDLIIDDQTVSANYAGLARATYAGLNATVSSSVGSISLDTIGSAIDSATVGSHQPTIIITTPTIWRALEESLFPSLSSTYGAAGSRRGIITRFGEAGAGQPLQASAGYNAMWYRAIPIVKDEKCPSGDIWFINDKVTYWSGLAHPKHGMVNLGARTIEGVGNPIPRNHGIAWTGFKEPLNQDGETGQFILYGQMICEMPRYNGKVEGATA